MEENSIYEEEQSTTPSTSSMDGENSLDGGLPHSARNDETAGTTETTETTTNNDNPEEATERSNLYDNTDNETTDAEVDYVNFEDEELTEFKDIFKDSKITKAEFNSFREKIEEKASAKQFNRDMIEIYGEDAPQVLSDYQKLTNDIFTPEEKETLNNLPSIYKTLLVKMGKALGDKQNKLMEDYGVLNQETQAMPEQTKYNANERFSKLTEQLLNGRLTPEEDARIRQERLELAKYM